MSLRPGAIHEAGHAAMAITMGLRCFGVEAFEHPDAAGRIGVCYVESVSKLSDPSASAALAEIVTALAADAAIQAFTGSRPHPDRTASDREHAGGIAGKFCSDATSRRVFLEGMAIFAAELADRPDVKRRTAFIAAALALKGRLNEQELRQIIRQADSTQEAAR